MNGMKRGTLYRLTEMIPGILVWGTFALALVFSLVKPFWVIVFIILFDLYWLLRVAYFLIVLLHAWREYQKGLATDWYALLQQEKKPWRHLTHCIFLPTVNESEEIVDATLASLARMKYPASRFIVVLAGEERARSHFSPIAEAMKKKYTAVFKAFLTTVHPSNLSGEIISKGSNTHYAGRQVQAFLDEKKIAYADVIVSTFDIDTIAHEQYFACLTKTYVNEKDPTRASYQPVVLYNNTIWQSFSPMRLAAFSTTFWLLSELVRPDRLFTFSSHSMSFQALADVDFWEKDAVSEDSRIFLQCFIRYNGNYRVVPLYIPVSMDTVSGKTPRRAFINLYKQQRRWAWGVEHFPYLVYHFFARPNAIPLFKKIKMLWNQTEGMYTWATAPVLIFFLGRLPLVFAPAPVTATALAQNTPFILEWLLNASLVVVFVVAFLSFFLLPRPPVRTPLAKRASMILQWILLPLTMIVFSSLPAIDAQTRLMTGRYLGFQVSEKRTGQKGKNVL